MKRAKRGFTLVELLVSISILALLTTLLLPALAKARHQARQTLGLNNQRAIVAGVTFYALDHNDRFPESVATIGEVSGYWNWHDPRTLTGYRKRSPRLHRSMSAYLHDYLENPALLHCPEAPARNPYLHAAWQAGDQWDHPQTPPIQDPLLGTYCFYWNYVAVAVGRRSLFQGPARLTGGHGQSPLLTSDYFGFGHWRNKDFYGHCLAYGSCQRFSQANVTEGTEVSCDYWSRPGTIDWDSSALRLQAGYLDGHVESYGPAEVITVKVIKDRENNTTYDYGLGPGDFFLPAQAIY